MDYLLNDWVANSAAAMGEETSEAVNVGLRQLAREILTAEEALDLNPDLISRLRTWAPQIPVADVANIADAQFLILADNSPAIATAVANSLGQSLTLGEGIGATVRRLRSSMDAEDWRLERIARTEINNAVNEGHLSTLNQASSRFPEMGLQEQWSAFRDSRTSQICLALDGTITSVGGTFTTEGLTYTTTRDGVETIRDVPPFTNRRPPAHPNCRSRLVPYSSRWASI